MAHRKRGRPKGTTGPAKPRVAVVKWKPSHDHIVLLYLAGHDNKEIAALTGYTPERVGQLLLDPRAQELISKGRARIKEKLLDDIDIKIALMAQKGVANLESTVNATINVLHPAKRHQDKVSLELISMARGNGAVKSSEDTLPREVAERLTKALERSNRVREIEALPIAEARVING